MWGVGHHQLLLGPNPSLVVGKLNRNAPNGSFDPPRPVGWSPPHPFLGPHPGALPSPKGYSPLPSSPQGKPGACPRSAQLLLDEPWLPLCFGVPAVLPVPAVQHHT